MSRAWTAAALATGLGLGFALGRAREGAPAPATPEAPRRALRMGPLTCVNVTEARADEDRDARLATCEAKLADLKGPKPTFAEPWPEDAGVESPERWTAAMSEVFAQCGLGLELEAADCEEYPCVAALRGAMPEEDTVKLKERLAACPAWQRWAAQTGDPEAELQPMDLRCPDGSYQSTIVFLAYDSESPTYEERVGGDAGFVEAIMMFGRRTSSVAQHWRCD